MNPITVAGGIAALVVLAYTHHVAYSAGASKVQSKWNADIIVRQKDLSDYKDRLLLTERALSDSQKEAQNAHDRENEAFKKLVALQRTRVTGIDERLRVVSDELAKRLKANAEDSAALLECKTAANAYRSVFDSCVGRYRELGELAQQRVAAAVSSGLECERSYDAARQTLMELSNR